MNLVIGATGIVGSHVLLHLMQSSRSVTAARRSSSNTSQVKALFAHFGAASLFDKIIWRELDLEDYFSIDEALEGIDCVYHCAGLVSFDPALRRQLFEVNEKGTANVVNACLLQKIPLCHVSSIATLNNLDRSGQIDESVFWKRSGKESDYAISKYNAEREVWRGIEEGLKAVIVNPGLILAAGFWQQSSSNVFNVAYRGNKYYTAGRAGYVLASDVAKVMVDLMDQQKYGQRYILVEGNYMHHEFMSMLADAFGKKVPVVQVGRPMLGVLCFADWLRMKIGGKKRMLTRTMLQALFNQQEYSSEKLKKQLDFTFTSVSKTLPDLCQKYVKDHENP